MVSLPQWRADQSGLAREHRGRAASYTTSRHTILPENDPAQQHLDRSPKATLEMPGVCCGANTSGFEDIGLSQRNNLRRTDMFTRRQALLGAAAATMLASMPPMTAFASEEEIAALPRRRVTLVPPS